jgi:hypothetical protein
MKESMWGYWIIVLGIAVFAIMMVLQNYSVTDEQSFFLAKENLASSMKEAVDYAYFTDASPTITEDNYMNSNEIYGRFKINREKLVENFIRRFADTVDISKTYTINFYYISEIPPAASVEVVSSTGKTNFGSTQNAASEEISTSSRFTGILFTTEEYTPGFNTAG